MLKCTSTSNLIPYNQSNHLLPVYDILSIHSFAKQICFSHLDRFFPLNFYSLQNHLTKIPTTLSHLALVITVLFTGKSHPVFIPNLMVSMGKIVMIYILMLSMSFTRLLKVIFFGNCDGRKIDPILT